MSPVLHACWFLTEANVFFSFFFPVARFDGLAQPLPFLFFVAQVGGLAQPLPLVAAKRLPPCAMHVSDTGTALPYRRYAHCEHAFRRTCRCLMFIMA